MSAYRHLFGPVPSRRFGRSLGIDLTPNCTCSFDCVFCQVGRTAELTRERKEYVPTDEVLAELRDWMENDGKADVVTLAGSGEPTLHTRFGEVLEAIAGSGRYPAVLLSNGTTFDLPEVREDARKADIVKVSLSAWDDASLRRINRPAEGVRFGAVLDGYRAFRRGFGGQFWAEVFVVPGVNDGRDAMARIAELAGSVGFDRVQLNTAVRPAAEKTVAPLPVDLLNELAELFHPRAEVVMQFVPGSEAPAADSVKLLAMLRRRPCTAEQVAVLFGLEPDSCRAVLDSLVRRGTVATRTVGCDLYYSAFSE